jgi:DNA polymerase-3 subunit delta'
MNDLATAPKDADLFEGFRSPRQTGSAAVLQNAVIYGFSNLRTQILEQFEAGQLHHAWLLRGPRGVGKASFVYEIACHLLSGRNNADEAIANTARHVKSGAHPRFAELRPTWHEKTKKFRTGISVDDSRKLQWFLNLSASDGGWRVVMVDSVDALTREAANALLKVLEEPGAKTVFFILSHGEKPPLPTIISRCRTVDCRALNASEAQRAFLAADTLGRFGKREWDRLAPLAAMDGGHFSPGAAIRYALIDGPAIYQELISILRGLPHLDAGRLDRFTGSVSRRAGADRFAAVTALLPLLCERMAKAALLSEEAIGLCPIERGLAQRWANTLDCARFWAEAASICRHIFADQALLNLDPGRTILDIARRLEEEAAARIPTRP